jgi:hypothetical protein
VDERVGTRDVGKRRGLTRNVPEVTDLIHRTPFIKHSHPLAQYLQEGETLIDDGFVPEDLHYDYSLYTVANPTLGPTDRVFLEIRGEGDDVCYIGPEPMHIEVLSGTGILRTMSLDDPRASIQSHNGPCESWGVESELRPGMVVDIEPNTRVQYLAKRGPLILRDTTLGFEEHYELPTERYFASRGALHGPVSGISLDR